MSKILYFDVLAYQRESGAIKAGLNAISTAISQLRGLGFNLSTLSGGWGLILDAATLRLNLEEECRKCNEGLPQWQARDFTEVITTAMQVQFNMDRKLRQSACTHAYYEFTTEGVKLKDGWEDECRKRHTSYATEEQEQMLENAQEITDKLNEYRTLLVNGAGGAGRNVVGAAHENAVIYYDSGKHCYAVNGRGLLGWG